MRVTWHLSLRSSYVSAHSVALDSSLVRTNIVWHARTRTRLRDEWTRSAQIMLGSILVRVMSCSTIVGIGQLGMRELLVLCRYREGLAFPVMVLED